MANASLAEAQAAGFTLLPGRTRLLINPAYPGFLFRLLDATDDMSFFKGYARVNGTKSFMAYGRYKSMFFTEGMRLGFMNWERHATDREPGDYNVVAGTRYTWYIHRMIPKADRATVMATINGKDLGVIGLSGHAYGYAGLTASDLPALQYSSIAGAGELWSKNFKSSFQTGGVFDPPTAAFSFLRANLEIKIAETVLEGVDKILKKAAEQLPSKVPADKRNAWLVEAQRVLTQNDNPGQSYKTAKPGTLEFQMTYLDNVWYYSVPNAKRFFGRGAIDQILFPEDQPTTTSTVEFQNRPYEFPWLFSDGDGYTVVDAYPFTPPTMSRTTLPGKITVGGSVFDVRKLMAGMMFDPDTRPVLPDASLAIEDIDPVLGGAEQTQQVQTLRGRRKQMTFEDFEGIRMSNGPVLAMAAWSIDKADEYIGNLDS